MSARTHGFVCVCVVGSLFSVVSLIMRKLFNVCLPVERGRECETVIAESERKNLREGARQTLLLMRYDLSDDDTHVCLASIRAAPTLSVCVWPQHYSCR